jgi:hypothetical protein
MHQRIRELRDADSEGRTPEHLVAAQRTLLAYGKYIDVVGSARMVRILASLYHQGLIDPVIRRVLESNLASYEASPTVMQAFTDAQSSGKIDPQVVAALNDFVYPPVQPFVSIKQEHLRMPPQPEYVQVG